MDEIAITDYQLHQRIRDEQRHRREHRLWLVAVGSAIIAVLSAVAAWISVFIQMPMG